MTNIPTRQAEQVKSIYLRDWVGRRVYLLDSKDRRIEGVLHSVSFSTTTGQVDYVVLDGKTAFNFAALDQIGLV